MKDVSFGKLESGRWGDRTVFNGAERKMTSMNKRNLIRIGVALCGWAGAVSGRGELTAADELEQMKGQHQNGQARQKMKRV